MSEDSLSSDGRDRPNRGSFNAASRRGVTTRRRMLAAGGAAVLGGLAGCLESGSDDGGSAGPETPWTTEELAAEIDGSGLTIYAAAGTREAWNQLVNVVNDEYGTSLDPEMFISDGGKVGQRVVQERQAGQDQADIISQGTALYNRFHEEDVEAGEYYELGLNEDYWFVDELHEAQTEPWYVSALNGGPSTCMAINPDRFDELGLDYPTTWNDLFDDQYEGVKTPLASYVVPNRIGWIAGYHAEQRGVEPEGWMRNMMDHVDFFGVQSHTQGARQVGQGDAPFMFYNFPWSVREVAKDFPVDIHYPEGVHALMSSGHLAINNEAPHPWAARFLVSASVEPAVQRRIVNEVEEFAPGRLDLDYSEQDLNSYYQGLLTADVTPTSFDEEAEFSQIGQNIVENVISD